MATHPGIRAILEQAYALSDSGDKATAIDKLAEARAIALRLKNREFLSEVENAYANYHRRFSDTALVLKHRRRAVALLGPKGHQLKLSIARSNLAGTLLAAGKYAEALALLYRSLDHFTKGLPDEAVCTQVLPEDATYLISTLYSLANLHQSMGDYASAKEYLNLQAEVISKFELPQDPDAFGLQCICCYETGDHEAAARYAELQLQHALLQRDGHAEAMAYSGLAMTSLRLGDLEQAREHNKCALEKAKQIEDRIRLVEVLCNQAEIEQVAQKHDERLSLLMSALEQVKALSVAELERRIHLALSDTWEALNNFQQALTHFKCAVGVRDALDTAAQQHEVSRLRQARMRRALAAEKKLLTQKFIANGSTPAQTIDIQHQLLQLAPSLSRTELKVCELLTLGASTKEIAEKMSASRHTVDGHRTAIRKKLGISSSENLSTWLMRASITEASRVVSPPIIGHP
jgi:DNA-binding CsgD family transcriptional regulator